MANICEFDMKVTGRKEDVLEFVDTLKLQAALYFDIDDTFEQGDYMSVTGFGGCKWSIYSSMRSSRYSFSLEDMSERLDLVIEAYSKEPGLEFQEHILIDKGEVLIDECVDYEEYFVEELDQEGLRQLCEKTGLSADEIKDRSDHNGDFTIGGFDDYGIFRDFMPRSLDMKMQEARENTDKDYRCEDNEIERG